MTVAFQFGDSDEVALQESYLAEWFSMMKGDVLLKKLDHTVTTVHSLYHEETDVKSWQSDVTIKADCERDPKEKDLKRIGIDERRDLLITTNRKLLSDDSVVIAIGDMIYFDSQWYVIMSKGKPNEGRLADSVNFLMDYHVADRARIEGADFD